MALEELIPLEMIPCINSKTSFKSTYAIINMKLTKLFNEVIAKVKKGILPDIEIHILVYSLRNVAFTEEIKGNAILLELSEHINQQFYGCDNQWSHNYILDKLQRLNNLIAHDIIINGSLIFYLENKIEWDLYSPIFIPLEILTPKTYYRSIYRESLLP